MCSFLGHSGMDEAVRRRLFGLVGGRGEGEDLDFGDMNMDIRKRNGI